MSRAAGGSGSESRVSRGRRGPLVTCAALDKCPCSCIDYANIVRHYRKTAVSRHSHMPATSRVRGGWDGRELARSEARRGGVRDCRSRLPRRRGRSRSVPRTGRQRRCALHGRGVVRHLDGLRSRRGGDGLFRRQDLGLSHQPRGHDLDGGHQADAVGHGGAVRRRPVRGRHARRSGHLGRLRTQGGRQPASVTSPTRRTRASAPRC